MIAAGVPVVPGTKEPVYDVKTGKRMAEEIGYPIMMIKAAPAAAEKECALPARRRSLRPIS